MGRQGHMKSPGLGGTIKNLLNHLITSDGLKHHVLYTVFKK